MKRNGQHIGKKRSCLQQGNGDYRSKRVVMCAMAAVFSMGMLSGCSRNAADIDYFVEDSESTGNGGAGGGATGVAQFEDAQQWETQVDTTGADGKNISVHIMCEPVVPKVSKMDVVEVSQVEWNEERKQQIAEAFFGNSTVYYKDEEHFTKQYIEDVYLSMLRQWLEEDQAIAAGEEENRYDLESEELEEEIEYIKGQLGYYQDLWNRAPDEDVPCTDYGVDEYHAERDGIHYDLSFGTWLQDDTEWSSLMIYTSEEEDLQVLCPMEGEGSYVAPVSMEEGEGENTCALSKEDARQQAEKLLEDIGMEYPVLYDIEMAQWTTYDSVDENPHAGVFREGEHTQIDGWIFTFGFGIDNLSFYHEFGSEESYEDWDVAAAGNYSMSNCAKVAINDKGIIYIYLYNPVEFVSAVNNVNLLSLDSVKKIMLNELTDNIARYPYGKENITGLKCLHSLDLIYFRVANEKQEGQYSYIPVWRLSQTNSDIEYGKIQNAVMVNAMDGSVIYVTDTE